VGFSYVSEFRSATGWSKTCEDTIYVDAHHVAKGVGKALLGNLVEKCRGNNFKVILAMISVGEDSLGKSSIELHRRFGFKDSGMIEKCGFKFDKWMDCAILSLNL
jgi:L-amino acid N-acyltransferase YncA